MILMLKLSQLLVWCRASDHLQPGIQMAAAACFFFWRHVKPWQPTPCWLTTPPTPTLLPGDHAFASSSHALQYPRLHLQLKLHLQLQLKLTPTIASSTVNHPYELMLFGIHPYRFFIFSSKLRLTVHLDQKDLAAHISLPDAGIPPPL